jgi:peptidoglycan-associated lipoprotein
MYRNSSLILVIGLILAGCSDMPTKDAPIEDRSGPGIAAGAAGGAKAGGSAAGASGAAGQTAGSAQAAGAGGGTAGVQTHGAGSQGVEVRPLPGATAGAADGSGVNGTAMAATPGTAAYATLRVPPKDAASPLAKRTIYFDYDSATIKDEFQSIIQAHAEFLKLSKEAKTVLQGHTDERGSRDYNLALGQRRAESVQQALILLGVDAMKLESVSLGEEKPVKDGHDESAWAQNRRVEIYYQGE